MSREPTPCPRCGANLRINFTPGPYQGRPVTLYPECYKCGTVARIGTMHHWDGGYVLGTQGTLYLGSPEWESWIIDLAHERAHMAESLAQKGKRK